MAKLAANVGSRALAYVRRGDKIVLESGSVSSGSRDSFIENSQAARQGDKVSLDSTTGKLTGALARTTYINNKLAALLGSKITGPRIIRGWITRGSRKTILG